MARTIVPLTEDVWADLGTAEMIITLHKSGQSGKLLLNQAEDDDSALLVTKNRYGDQFSNTTATDTIFAKATAPGWEVAVDI